MAGGKITHEEIVEMFGATMPIDVAVLLDRWPGGDPDGLRAILKERGEAWKQHQEAIAQLDAIYNPPHDHYGSKCPVTDVF